MSACDVNRQRICLYLDNELRGDDLAAFESHTNACPSCRQAVDAERRFFEIVRSARPLYTAPGELQSRVKTILHEGPRNPAPHHLYTSVREFIQRAIYKRPKFAWPLQVAIPAFAILAAVFVAVRFHHPRSELTSAAIQAHRQFVRGMLPLGVRSSSPEAISAWLTQRTAVRLKLPPYQEMPEGVQPVQLQGGRLTEFRNSRAAYVAYKVRNKPVSLIAVSASAAGASGGQKVVMGPLTFYYDVVDGYNVITWASKSRLTTYAMVSDGGEKPQQACIICHASPSANDRDLMRGLLKQ